MAWRYLAQRATTKAWLSLDLPITVGTLKWNLSGAGSLEGTVTPDVGLLRGNDGSPLLQEWGTLLYAEADGLIRWGGILVSSKWNGAGWTLEGAGFSTYPHGIPYGGSYSRIGVDPAQVVADIWSWLQLQPDGDLGVTVEGSTSVRVGTPAPATDATTMPTSDVPADQGPYELNWWDSTDCGSAIDSLASAAPFDWMERHDWNGAHTDILHRVVIGYPRLGRRRTDLQFEQGINISDVIEVDTDGDDYANEVDGIGAGEGAGSIRSTAALRDGRLRRVAVLARKDVKLSIALASLVRNELTVRQQLAEIASITVRNHPNAPIGSWQVGDDILVRADLPWLGRVSLWHRITAWELASETTAKLTLQRSDTFTYGG